MWNQKCGMTLIGRGDKPRDRWPSTDYHTSLSTGSVVNAEQKCGKVEQWRQIPLFDHESTLSDRTIASNERCPDILSDHPKV